MGGLFSKGGGRALDHAARAEHDRRVAARVREMEMQLHQERERATAELARKQQEAAEETRRRMEKMESDNRARLEDMRRQTEAAAAAALADTDRKLQEAAAAAAKAQAEAEARSMLQINLLRQQAESQAKAAEAAQARAVMAQQEADRLRAKTDEERESKFGIACPLDIDATKVNVAITGQSGSGKSSTVNAIVGSSVAAVDVVQCTTERKFYTITRSPVRLFDLPGAGTPEYPLETYYHEQGLKYFDIVLIMCANRFSQADLEIARLLAIQGVPFRLVRNMAGTAVAQNARKNIGEEETIRTIRLYLSNYLNQVADTTGAEEIRGQDVFIIDSNDLGAYDGRRMTEWAVSSIERQRM